MPSARASRTTPLEKIEEIRGKTAENKKREAFFLNLFVDGVFSCFVFFSYFFSFPSIFFSLFANRASPQRVSRKFPKRGFLGILQRVLQVWKKFSNFSDVDERGGGAVGAAAGFRAAAAVFAVFAAVERRRRRGRAQPRRRTVASEHRPLATSSSSSEAVPVKGLVVQAQQETSSVLFLSFLVSQGVGPRRGAPHRPPHEQRRGHARGDAGGDRQPSKDPRHLLVLLGGGAGDDGGDGLGEGAYFFV